MKLTLVLLAGFILVGVLPYFVSDLLVDVLDINNTETGQIVANITAAILTMIGVFAWVKC